MLVAKVIGEYSGNEPSLLPSDVIYYCPYISGAYCSPVILYIVMFHALFCDAKCGIRYQLSLRALYLKRGMNSSTAISILNTQCTFLSIYGFEMVHFLCSDFPSTVERYRLLW